MLMLLVGCHPGMSMDVTVRASVLTGSRDTLCASLSDLRLTKTKSTGPISASDCRSAQAR